MPVSAEEMYSGYAFRWVVKYPGGSCYWLKVNGDTMASGSPFRSKINTAVANWMGSPTKAYCTTSAFSDSNVDIGTATQTWWKEHGHNEYAVACTVLTDTDGKQIYTASDARYST